MKPKTQKTLSAASTGLTFPPVDLSDVAGLAHCKRALEVAAAGGHGIMFIGAPGSGKTLLIHALLGLLAGVVKKTISEVAVQAVSSADGHFTEYQADLDGQMILAAEARPCPCGWLGDPLHLCVCEPDNIIKHKKGIPNGYAIQTEVTRGRYRDILDLAHGREETSEQVIIRIRRARKAQTERFKDGRVNSQMNAKEATKIIGDSDCGRLIEMAIDRLGLSLFSVMEVMRVARTIADLDASEAVRAVHLSEAIQYRSPATE